jgi:hypothetical protein
MVGNIGFLVVVSLGAWLLLSVLVGMVVGACLRPRTRVVGGPGQLEANIRQSVRAA